jgi:hypothetical protein
MTHQAHQLMSTAKALANAGVSIAVHVGCLHEGGTDVELPASCASSPRRCAGPASDSRLAWRYAIRSSVPGPRSPDPKQIRIDAHLQPDCTGRLNLSPRLPITGHAGPSAPRATSRTRRVRRRGSEKARAAARVGSAQCALDPTGRDG